MINQIRDRKAEVINEFSLIVYLDGHIFPFSFRKFRNHMGFYWPNKQLQDLVGWWEFVQNQLHVS